MNEELEKKLKIFEEYSSKRRELLKEINIPDSCRDPLSEFSEYIVAILLNAEPVESRVNKGFDLKTPDGTKIEVKYLSNPEKEFRNWHKITFNGLRDKYALVYYENLSPKAVFVFQEEGLEKVCKALGKRHGNTDRELQFTKTNYIDLTTKPEQFRKLSVEIFIFPQVRSF